MKIAAMITDVNNDSEDGGDDDGGDDNGIDNDSG